MRGKLVLVMVLMILVMGMLGVVLRVQRVEASGTIFIRDTGDVEGTDKIDRYGNVYTFTDDINDSIVVERNNIIIDGSGYTLQGNGSGTGVDLLDRDNVTITNIVIRNFASGISLDNCIECNVSENSLENNQDGIATHMSIHNSIHQNNITNSSLYGMHFADSNGPNNITCNTISASHYGGMWLNNVSNAFMRSNSMFNNSYNFGAFFWRKSVLECINDIDTSNTVDGKPIYYWVSESDKNVPLDAGCVYLVNCTRIKVENLSLTNNQRGIMLAYTTQSEVRNNTVEDHRLQGVKLFHSTNNTVSENKVCIHTQGIIGLYLEGSSSNVISGNNVEYADNGIMIIAASNNNSVTANTVVASSTHGIYVSFSPYNRIHANFLTNNSKGLRLVHCSNNIIYHNNFMENAEQAYTHNSTNVWNKGFEGNYWSNYTGVDSDHNGIGDSWHEINENNTDHYPLMGMFNSFNTSPGKHVNVISNSTIEDFAYSVSNNTIRLHVSNMTTNQTYGFCRVCIPKDLMAPSYNVTINNGAIEVLHFNDTIHDNSTHTWIYFAYEHSIHEIIIVPEFHHSSFYHYS